MKKFRRIVLVYTLIMSFPAYAYIDPGIGLMFMQGVFAAMGFIIAFVKNPIEKIKRMIRKLRNKP